MNKNKTFSIYKDLLSKTTKSSLKKHIEKWSKQLSKYRIPILKYHITRFFWKKVDNLYCNLSLSNSKMLVQLGSEINPLWKSVLRWHESFKYPRKADLLEERIRYAENGCLHMSKLQGNRYILKILESCSNHKGWYCSQFEDLDELSAEYTRSVEFGVDETQIPIGYFVNASSFKSWNGRGVDTHKDGKLSKEVIIKYSLLSHKTAPPVEEIGIYVYNDNYIKIASYNAHRVAAALRRGDKFIVVRGHIDVHIVPKKYSSK